jgi:predicted ATPase
MLTRLYIDNYASFVNFEFRPSRTNLLIGDNGSGKTKILEVMGDIIALNKGGVPVEGCFPAYKRTAWEQRDKQTFELDIDRDGEAFKYLLEIAHEHDPSSTRTFIAREEVTVGAKPLFRYAEGRVELFRDDHSAGPSFAFSNRRSFLANLELSSENRNLMWFLNWIGGFWRFRLDPTTIKKGWLAEREDPYLAADGSNFAAFYRYMMQERPETIERIQSELRRVVGGLDRMRLKTLGDRKALVVDFSSADGAPEFNLPFFALSDGQVVLIVLYTILHAIEGSVNLLCIDEPDNFVALHEIQPWLQGLSDRHDTQAIIISHHPEVIDYLAADSVYLLTRRGSGLTRIQQPRFASEGGLKASEQLARGLLEPSDAR